MLPSPKQFGAEESGVRRVVDFWYKYAPQFGIEFVDVPVEQENDYDVFCIHAGASNKYPINRPICSVLHGLYWTADYNARAWEWRTNANVIESIRRSTVITVPSEWVAESIRRDVRTQPFIIAHGIEWKEWIHNEPKEDYVLWNKNRIGDVCSPEPVGALAERFPGMQFVSTFMPSIPRANIKEIGVIHHDQMKAYIQHAAVYLATTKETFGIGTLEALASGVPVLGFAHGGNLDIVKHKVTGYLAAPGDYADLAHGLEYCVKFRNVLSENAREDVKRWTWEAAVAKLNVAFTVAAAIWFDKQRPLTLAESEYRV